MSITFDCVAVVQASTKRKPDIDLTTGKAGEPVTNIPYLKCTRMVTPTNVHQLIETLHLGTLAVIKVCYTKGNLDIITGDVLVIASGIYAGEYPIRFVSEYPFGNDVRKELTIEVLKR